MIENNEIKTYSSWRNWHNPTLSPQIRNSRTWTDPQTLRVEKASVTCAQPQWNLSVSPRMPRASHSRCRLLQHTYRLRGTCQLPCAYTHTYWVAVMDRPMNRRSRGHLVHRSDSQGMHVCVEYCSEWSHHPLMGNYIPLIRGKDVDAAKWEDNLPSRRFMCQ